MISMDMGQLHTVASSASTSNVIPELPSFIALVCWQVWKARNAKVFRNEDHSADRLLMDCKAAVELWRYRIPRAKRQTATLKGRDGGLEGG